MYDLDSVTRPVHCPARLPESSLGDGEVSCETCWGYREMTAGRCQRCPWCAGKPPKVKGTVTDTDRSKIAKVAHAKRKARDAEDREDPMTALAMRFVSPRQSACAVAP